MYPRSAAAPHPHFSISVSEGSPVLHSEICVCMQVTRLSPQELAGLKEGTERNARFGVEFFGTFFSI
jgi:hypothetical protein